MKELTKKEFDFIIGKSKSLDKATVGDLIAMLKPFEDYYLCDPRCHYCGGELYLIKSKDTKERIKYTRDLINIYTEDDSIGDDLYDFMKSIAVSVKLEDD